MRPYLLSITVVLMAAAAFGQAPGPYPGGCFYGCGPYIPRLTTPEISLQQVSPNPVGATNATTGLIAGATNSTLSEVNGSTNSVYTEAVWYQGGGAPLIGPEVQLWPETIGREGRAVHGGMHEEYGREERGREERGPRKEDRVAWTYYAGPGEEWTGGSATKAVVPGKGERQPGHVYNNDDVSRQNEKNGTVKYKGKTEKI
jgi:hypothetical protein